MTEFPFITRGYNCLSYTLLDIDSFRIEKCFFQKILGETPACANVFEDFLRYMYTGKIQLDYATVIPLVSLADKYNVKDLLRLGLDYMARNVSTAAKKHQIVTWYQFATVAGHRRVAELTGNFIKWNFEVVSKTLDYSSLDLPQLIQFLEANDLVICKYYIFSYSTL